MEKRRMRVSENRVLMENMKKRDHLEEKGIDGRVILRWIFRK
jgi:hypothetical protein